MWCIYDGKQQLYFRIDYKTHFYPYLTNLHIHISAVSYKWMDLLWQYASRNSDIGNQVDNHNPIDVSVPPSR